MPRSHQHLCRDFPDKHDTRPSTLLRADILVILVLDSFDKLERHLKIELDYRKAVKRYRHLFKLPNPDQSILVSQSVFAALRAHLADNSPSSPQRTEPDCLADNSGQTLWFDIPVEVDPALEGWTIKFFPSE